METGPLIRIAITLQQDSSENDNRRQLYAILAEARALVTRLEILVGGSSATLHPITAWRKRRNIAQGTLAKAAGISGPALSRIEHLPGFRGRQDTRAKIAATLNVPEEWLFSSDAFQG